MEHSIPERLPGPRTMAARASVCRRARSARMTIHTEFDRALRLHQEGKLREAYFRYDAILKAEPAHAGALHYSGVVLYQAGKLPEAAERIRAALAVDPAQPEA